MFEVAYETTFCATHRLLDGGVPIEPLHGHDWRVEVVAAGETLSHIGVIIDFEVLKEVVAEVKARFHYKDINEHPDFAGESVTAEIVARYFFDAVSLARTVDCHDVPGGTARERVEIVLHAARTRLESGT